jgi:hypothetical protein
MNAEAPEGLQAHQDLPDKVPYPQHDLQRAQAPNAASTRLPTVMKLLWGTHEEVACQHEMLPKS